LAILRAKYSQGGDDAKWQYRPYQSSYDGSAQPAGEAPGVHAVSHAVPVITGAVIGRGLYQHMKNASMPKVADLVKEGVLNPEIGRRLIVRASKVADQGSQLSLAAQLKRMSLLESTFRQP
jgi:hypothetical protein